DSFRCGGLVGGDVVGDSQCLDAGLGPGQAGGGAAALFGQDRGDGAVVVVGGQAADQVQGVLVGGAGLFAVFGHRHGQGGGGAALPDDAQLRDAGGGVGGQHDL